MPTRDPPSSRPHLAPQGMERVLTRPSSNHHTRDTYSYHPHQPRHDRPPPNSYPIHSRHRGPSQLFRERESDVVYQTTDYATPTSYPPSQPRYPRSHDAATHSGYYAAQEGLTPSSQQYYDSDYTEYGQRMQFPQSTDTYYPHYESDFQTKVKCAVEQLLKSLS
ncbi:hypothetical protein BaRGS_00034653 [Batillaria attramentaria]|uniref:Uncharacterized protein n=1 Tax=Batillaria attramentaria TaxID=370345 RepID=A0ABD0JGS9_9CAEN